MTREDAVNRFKGIRESFSISIAQSKFYPSKVILNELCDMAVEALSAEPKTKCVAQIRIDRNDMEDLVDEKVNEMSEPNTGHWISDNLVGWKCSECGRHIVLNIEVGNYCPNCGAKMEGSIVNEQSKKLYKQCTESKNEDIVDVMHKDGCGLNCGTRMDAN